MVDWLTSLPYWLGILLSAATATALGVGVYWLSFRVIAQRSDDVAGPAVSNLFRVLAILISLMLALAFDDVVAEWRAAETAIKGETAAISDVVESLEEFDDGGDARASVLAYTQAVVDDDWPALEDDELSAEASTIFRDTLTGIIALDATDALEDELKTRMLDDLDVISNARQDRLNAALSQPPAYTLVILLGFLVIMVYFGIYRPNATMVALAAFYTAFIGVVVYLILAMSDPFQGGLGLDPDQLVNLLDVQSAR